MAGRRLGFEERCEIKRGLAKGWSYREVARGLGRPPSTVAREVSRNGGRRSYQAWNAQGRANREAHRPKPYKLEGNGPLAREVERLLRRRWSPEQIAGRLRREHPDDARWWVSAESIYRSLFVETRGGLKKELTVFLRSQRPKRRRRVTTNLRGKLADMVPIAQRPAEVDDRRVPGHWEGDLIIGSDARSALGTLVERTSRFLVPFPLPHDHTAPTTRRALSEAIQGLPDHLRRSLTWDQGKEMAEHVRFSIDTGIQVYFCDAGKPYQRGTNENTNRLLRQYFPKGTSFTDLTYNQLAAVAEELNSRPRKLHDWETPAEVYHRLVAMTP
ncbi:MAG: IS30 family transposase [Acidimicrobiia bacterium]